LCNDEKTFSVNCYEIHAAVVSALEHAPTVFADPRTVENAPTDFGALNQRVGSEDSCRESQVLSTTTGTVEEDHEMDMENKLHKIEDIIDWLKSKCDAQMSYECHHGLSQCEQTD